MADERESDAVVDLLGGTGTGPLWGMASSDLLEGGGVARVDEREHALVPGSALLVEKGSSRTLRAGPDGVRYVSIHRRRGPLQITASASSGHG
jgi:hypothetical protein